MLIAPSRRAGRADITGLAALRPLPTAAQRAADVIRENVFEGRFAPGTALPEAALSSALQVSRNTVREAFRTLIGEHLLVHEPHKGVTVRRLTEDDVTDIYRLRHIFELAALDPPGEEGSGHDAAEIGDIGAMVTAAENAAEAGDWAGAGTAILRFHARIVGLLHSPRVDETFRRLMTELRLGFLAAGDQSLLHGPFLPRNRTIQDHLARGALAEARREMAAYLDDAEKAVLKAVAG